ncbi:zinc ribbon domain-containing protein [Streptomyces sp. NPDC005533]|uniref:zinc ribbon domain-containing protein n=1 Tax=Streptomyces sp. NPDC005533 TaxID=3364723 RepID=UPI0036B57F57
MLEYKAARYGRTFHRIGRFEPTSQVCSQCGAKAGPKPLHIRTWVCAACGAVLDRHINAAVNVAKAAGLAVTLRSAGKTGTRPGTERRNRNPPRRSTDRGRKPRPLGRGAEVNRPRRSGAPRAPLGTSRRSSSPRRNSGSRDILVLRACVEGECAKH